MVDAVTWEADAPGRLVRRDRRSDLDRAVTPAPTTSPEAGTAPTPAQLARTGYPGPLRSGAASLGIPGPAGVPPVDAPRRNALQPQAAGTGRGTS